MIAAEAAAGVALLLMVPSDPKPLARLNVLHAQLAVATTDRPALVPTPRDRDLAEGDVIQTDTAGRAEIHYFDGSLTRLGGSSRFRVERLVQDGSRRRIAGKLEVGESFHRVKHLAGGGSRFEVRTANAVAAVRGTAFVVSCPRAEACIIGVVDGAVAVSGANGETVLVSGGQAVDVTPGGQLAPLRALARDRWLAENERLDRGADPAPARPVVTEPDAAGQPKEGDGAPPGKSKDGDKPRATTTPTAVKPSDGRSKEEDKPKGAPTTAKPAPKPGDGKPSEGKPEDDGAKDEKPKSPPTTAKPAPSPTDDRPKDDKPKDDKPSDK